MPAHACRYRHKWAEKREEDKQRDQVLMYAFVSKQGVKLTHSGLVIDSNISRAVWTHRNLRDVSSPAEQR